MLSTVCACSWLVVDEEVIRASASPNSEIAKPDAQSKTAASDDGGHPAQTGPDLTGNERTSVGSIAAFDTPRILAKSAATAPPTVVLISIDGLAPRFLEAELDAKRLPGFARLQREAAFTHNARTEARTSVTLPNHTSMVTGRPAAAVADASADMHHGLLDNYDLGEGRTIHNAGNPAVGYVASVFDEVHDRGGYTALYVGKPKFLVMQRSYVGTASRPDLIDQDDGPDKIDDFAFIEDTRSLASAFSSAVRAGVTPSATQRNFAMLHLRDTDSIGHAYGWGSDEYLGALRSLDELLVDVLDTIGGSSVFSRTWLIVTTDHGGVGTGHYDTSDLDTVRIPFYVWGPGIPAGADLYELTAGTRVDPGDEIPMDGTERQPIRNGDAGNLALWLLQLPPIDGSSHRGMTLALDEK